MRISDVAETLCGRSERFRLGSLTHAWRPDQYGEARQQRDHTERQEEDGEPEPDQRVADDGGNQEKRAKEDQSERNVIPHGDPGDAR